MRPYHRALAHDHCPDAILIGQLVNESDGSIHHGLTVGGALPAGASTEAKAKVLLGGMVAERLLFGSHGNGATRDLEMLNPLVEEIMAHEDESRSAAQIRDYLIDETNKLLQEHRGSLELLYAEAVERVETQHGFAALEQPSMAVKVFTGEMIQYVWDHSKRKNT